jgi:hypothetical protein
MFSNMRVVVVLILVLTAGCITQTPVKPTRTLSGFTSPVEEPECGKPSDCQGVSHEPCPGYWICVEGECVWNCSTLLPSIDYSGKEFSYSITGCDIEKGSAGVNSTLIHVKDGTIILNQTLSYYCCAALELTLKKKENQYTITEANRGKACRCTCDHTINAAVKTPGKGKYDVTVVGVAFQKHKGGTLAKETLTIS